MPSGHNPHTAYNVYDAALAAELRRVREAAGLDGDHVAKALQWSPAKISRVERNRTGIRLPDLERLAGHYVAKGAAGADWAERITAYAREQARAGYTSGLAAEDPLHGARLASYAGEWAPSLAPRLAWTPGYAAAALAALDPGTPPYDYLAALDQWQARLGHGLAARAVVHQHALATLVGDPRVMAGQLRALARPRRGLQLRVLPADAAGPYPACGFTHLAFPSVAGFTAPDVVLIPQVHETARLAGKKTAWHYADAFEKVWRAAIDPAEPVKLALAAWA